MMNEKIDRKCNEINVKKIQVRKMLFELNPLIY